MDAKHPLFNLVRLKINHNLIIAALNRSRVSHTIKRHFI